MLRRFIEFNEVAGYFFFPPLRENPLERRRDFVEFLNGSSSRARRKGRGETPWEEEKKGRRRKIIIIPVDGDIVVDRWTDIKRFDRVC